MGIDIGKSIYDLRQGAEKKLVEYIAGNGACSDVLEEEATKNYRIGNINKETSSNIKSSKKKIDSSMKGQWVTAAKKALDEKNKKLEEL